MSTTLIERAGVTVTQFVGPRVEGMDRVKLQVDDDAGRFVQLNAVQVAIVAHTMQKWLRETGRV